MTNDPFRLSHRSLTEKEANSLIAVKRKAAELYDLIESLGPSRDASLAKTKLEEAVMWATKHITA